MEENGGRKEIKKIEKINRLKIGALIMASGKSERMGENKLLLEYKGLSLIERVLEKILNIQFYEAVVVVSDAVVKEKCLKYVERAYRKKRNSVNSSIGREKIYIIENENFEKGQSESIKLGLKTLNECDGYMFFSGDQPCLSGKTVKKIIENFEKDKIVIPKYNGKEGLPTIFGKKFKKSLLKLEGDTGGKLIIKNNADKVKFVEIENETEGIDIDTREEYENLKRGVDNVYSGNNNEQ